MSKFEFRDELSIEISGHTFSLRIDEEFKQTMLDQSKMFQDIANSTDIKSIDEAKTLMLCEEALDKTLGQGAFKTIFTEQRKASVQDVIDILYFVATEISKKRKRTAERDNKNTKQNK